MGEKERENINQNCWVFKVIGFSLKFSALILPCLQVELYIPSLKIKISMGQLCNT